MAHIQIEGNHSTHMNLGEPWHTYEFEGVMAHIYEFVGVMAHV